MYYFNDHHILCAFVCFCNQDVGDLSRNQDIVGGSLSGLGEGQSGFKITEMEKMLSSPKCPELL
jgi:hypothetical protein